MVRISTGAPWPAIQCGVIVLNSAGCPDRSRERFDLPLSETALQVVLGRIHRARQQLDELLDDDDLRTLDVLSDANDPRGVTHRGDVFVTSSRQIVSPSAARHVNPRSRTAGSK
jgi:hypothetical protein